MRIVVVSAHYPPEFVSGGTLVPQRLARGLAARGHDVWVYAGSLDQTRTPLDTWEDVDPTGLAVRWIASWPWIGWSDRHNFDNPDVAGDFAAWLTQVRPDVVHLHSLQSLGCGLAEAAAAAGAAVVVTMHDFWWICARQFLADRSHRPCCLIVSAGTCPCEVDRTWLDERTSRLNRALAVVDRVLVPSAIAKAVLEANGVAPERLVVDENGLPAQTETEPAPAPAGRERARVTEEQAGAAGGMTAARPLRLLYAGGPDRMKGADVLVAAAEILSGRPGWHLTAYGLDPATVPASLPIDVKAPFAEGELATVLAAADVLVVPSVMRETFSILTREALTCGVPVVTTDTLGPEEVVVDGHNGLVVPAADPSALAHAIGRLLDDPELLRRLRDAAAAVAIRPIEDQVGANEAGYRELLARRRAAAAEGPATALPSRPTPPVRRVVFAVGIDGAPLRYRARLPAEALGLLGVSSEVVHYRDPTLPELLATADAAVFYRVPATVGVLDLIATTRRRGTPVLFDVDDLIFDPDLAAEIPALAILPPSEAALWMEGVRRYRTTMEACDAYIGSTEQLCRHAALVTGLPAERFGNGIGLLLSRMSDQALHAPRPEGPVRMGYFSGTTTHDRDWAEIEPVVLEAMARRPDLELWLVGHLKASSAVEPFRHRIHSRPMVPWTELPALLRAVDVNLVPLEAGSRFNEAKSAIKWLEAALVATPTIATPTQPFEEVIVPGVTGLLAAKPEEWGDAIDELVGDRDLRARMGAAARRRALLDWSPHLQGRRYLAILERSSERVRQVERRRPSPNWAPVALDEPPMDVPLDSYSLTGSPAGVVLDDPALAVAPATARNRLRGLLGRGVDLLRGEGAAVTVRRLVRVVDRRARTARHRVRDALGRRR